MKNYMSNGIEIYERDLTLWERIKSFFRFKMKTKKELKCYCKENEEFSCSFCIDRFEKQGQIKALKEVFDLFNMSYDRLGLSGTQATIIKHKLKEMIEKVERS